MILGIALEGKPPDNAHLCAETAFGNVLFQLREPEWAPTGISPFRRRTSPDRANRVKTLHVKTGKMLQSSAKLSNYTLLHLDQRLHLWHSSVHL